jgi:hypothetical protein
MLLAMAALTFGATLVPTLPPANCSMIHSGSGPGDFIGIFRSAEGGPNAVQVVASRRLPSGASCDGRTRCYGVP